jgi:aminoglycoside 6'-N-acetyltransferase I
MLDTAAGFAQKATAAAAVIGEMAKRQKAHISVRRATVEDCEHVARMCAELWPHASAEEHLSELLPKAKGTPTRQLPVTVFVAQSESPDTQGSDDALVGFVEVGLRSHADGCDESQLAGFLEGWFVRKDWRRIGIGRMLVAAAEEWASRQGCKEMASDTWINNKTSQRAHEAIGYEVVDRCVNYRKNL